MSPAAKTPGTLVIQSVLRATVPVEVIGGEQTEVTVENNFSKVAGEVVVAPPVAPQPLAVSPAFTG